MDKISKELVSEINELISNFVEIKKKEIIYEMKDIIKGTRKEMRTIINNAKNQLSKIIEQEKRMSVKTLNNIKKIERSSIEATEYINGSAEIINEMQQVTIMNVKFLKKYGK